MKFRVEAECTPLEARAFLGLPDVAPLNEQMVREMASRMSGNMSLLKPEELMRNWFFFFGLGHEIFIKMMTSAATSGLGGTPSR